MSSGVKPEPQLAARIREIKAICGVTYREIGAAIGVTTQTAQQYATGLIHSIPGDKLPLIASAFGCEVRHLYMPPGSPLPARLHYRRRRHLLPAETPVHLSHKDPDHNCAANWHTPARAYNFAEAFERELALRIGRISRTSFPRGLRGKTTLSCPRSKALSETKRRPGL